MVQRPEPPDSRTQNHDDVGDSDANYALLKRAKQHDYFTSALPWPQKGPGVEIPLGKTAPLTKTDTSAGFGIPTSTKGRP